MIFAWDFKENLLIPLGELGGFFMLLLGIIWVLYAVYETKRRKSFKKRKVEDWDFDMTKFLKVLTYIGFIVGLLCIVSGVSGLMFDIPPSVAYRAFEPPPGSRNLFTSILLIVFGILTFVKPANDLPLASLVGMLAATLVVILIALLLPQTVIDVIAAFINPKILLSIVFIIIFAIVALTAKFYTAGFMAVSKALSWPPLAIIVAIFCFLQGFLLVVIGVSISGAF